MHFLCVISPVGANSPLNESNEELRMKHSDAYGYIFFVLFCSFKMFVNTVSSDSEWAVTCAGSPGGGVLSPLLYILYTDDCHSNLENSCLVKFADNSALLSLLLGTQDGHGVSPQWLYIVLWWVIDIPWPECEQNLRGDSWFQETRTPSQSQGNQDTWWNGGNSPFSPFV